VCSSGLDQTGLSVFPRQSCRCRIAQRSPQLRLSWHSYKTYCYDTHYLTEHHQQGESYDCPAILVHITHATPAFLRFGFYVVALGFYTVPLWFCGNLISELVLGDCLGLYSLTHGIYCGVTLPV